MAALVQGKAMRAEQRAASAARMKLVGIGTVFVLVFLASLGAYDRLSR